MKKTQHASNIKWPPPFNLSLSLSYSFSSLSRSHLREWELAVSIVAAAYLLLCFCSNGKKFRKKFFFSLPFVFKCTVEKKDIARGKNKKNGKTTTFQFSTHGPPRPSPANFVRSFPRYTKLCNFFLFAFLAFQTISLSLSLCLSLSLSLFILHTASFKHASTHLHTLSLSLPLV